MVLASPNRWWPSASSTTGESDVGGLSYHPLTGESVFDQASAGKTAGMYAEDAASNHQQSSSGLYAVRPPGRPSPTRMPAGNCAKSTCRL